MLATGFLEVKTINDFHSCSIDPQEWRYAALRTGPCRLTFPSAPMTAEGVSNRARVVKPQAVHIVHQPVHLESNSRVHGVDVSMTTPYTSSTLFGRGEHRWRLGQVIVS